MLIQHLKYPFPHTIIYDMFDETELTQIRSEVDEFVANTIVKASDEHHARLFSENKTTSLCLDQIYEGARNNSNILKLIKKVYELNSRGILVSADNPFLKYVSISNSDNTYLQLYRDGSSYFEHDDKAVLTFLYPFKGDSTGGNLIFTDYNYTPHLNDNCCLIFPSFERHRLSPVEANDKEAVVRFSINQRIFVHQ